MRTKLFFFFLLFLVVVMADAQNVSSKKVLPEWMKQSFVDNKWVGVSPPTPDKNKGRSVALINAALGYLRSQHTGNLQYRASIEMNSEQSDDKLEESEEYTETALVTYTGFSCKVTNEYCNGRGEYFVECRFVLDETNTQDLLVISKDYTNKIVNDVSVATVETDLKMKLDRDIYACKLSCNAKSNEVPVFQLTVDNAPFEQVKNLKYEKIQWNNDIPEGALVISGDELGQSLGIAQMAVSSLLPFIPHSLKCSSVETSNMTENRCSQKNVSNLMAKSYSLPIKTSPLLLSNKGFAIKVHNTNFDDVTTKQFDSSMIDSYDEKSKTILEFKPIFDENDKDGAYWRLIWMGNNLLSSIPSAAELLGKEALSSKMINETHEANSNTKDDSSDLNAIDMSNELCNIGVKWDFGNVSREKMGKIFTGKGSRSWNDIRGIWIKFGHK